MTLEEWEEYLRCYIPITDDAYQLLKAWREDRKTLLLKYDATLVRIDELWKDRQRMLETLRYLLSDTSETAMLLKQTLKIYDEEIQK